MSLTKQKSLNIPYKSKEDGQIISPSEWNADFEHIQSIGNENKGYFNDLIDALESVADGSSGADSVGATPLSGVVGSTVQAILEALKTLIDGTYTKSASDSLLSNKADNTLVANHVKTVSYDSTNGKFTFTTEGGTSTVIDTMLEKIITNFSYDSETQSIIFTASDGTTSSVSIAEFITINEFQDSDQIDFTVNDGVVTATIKDGSVTDSMLSSALATALITYKNDAATSASNASASEANALESKNSAATSASTATTKAEEAASSANAAQTNASTAVTKAQEASTSASNASTSASNAEDSAEDAEAWAIGKRNGADVPPTDPTYNNNAKYWKDQAQAQAGDKLPIAGGTLTGALTLAGDPTADLEAVTKQYADMKVAKETGKGLSTEDYTAAEKSKLSGIATSATANTVLDLTGVLTTTWAGTEAPYTQAVTVTGILATDMPIIDLIASDTFATAEAENEAWGKIYKAVTSENTITFYATEAPTVAMNFSVKVVRIDG